MTQKEEIRTKLKEYNWSGDRDYQLACIAFNEILLNYISKDEILKAIKQLNDGDWRKPINSDDLRQKLEALGIGDEDGNK